MSYEVDLQRVKNVVREWLADPNMVILDTETTDLNGYLVQIAVIDRDGNTLLDTLVNPQSPINPKAARVHGLTATKLQGQPVFAQIRDQLFALLEGKRVVIYNMGFDKSILWNELFREYNAMKGEDTTFVRSEAVAYIDAILDRSWYCCAMDAYSTWCGEWNEYHGNYRWQKLPYGDHTALGDCRGTLRVLQEMAR